MTDLDALANENRSQAERARAGAAREIYMAYEDERADARALAERGARLERLIRWLAIPWSYQDPSGDVVFVDPLFPEVDPWTKQALVQNTELKRTWYEVVRGIDLTDESPEEESGSGTDPEPPTER